MSRTSALASAHACGAVVVQNGLCHRFSLQFRHSGSIPPISTIPPRASVVNCAPKLGRV
nr:MAG TPA: hypothetical protein [Caudoviricetes sp.]